MKPATVAVQLALCALFLFVGDVTSGGGSTSDITEELGEEVEELRQAFKVFDKDGNGKITRKEFSDTVRFLGDQLSDEEIQAVMAFADVDANGTVDFEEFLKIMVESESVDSAIDKKIMTAFRLLDKDKDGSISPFEIHDFVADVENDIMNKEIQDVVKELHVNGDGNITYNEFVKGITKKN